MCPVILLCDLGPVFCRRLDKIVMPSHSIGTFLPPFTLQIRRRIDEKNKLLRAMAASGKDAAYAVVDLTDVSDCWGGSGWAAAVGLRRLACGGWAAVIGQHRGRPCLTPPPVPHRPQVNNQWESFTTQLQQFDAHLDEQKQQLGTVIAKQLDEFRCGHQCRRVSRVKGVLHSSIHQVQGVSLSPLLPPPLIPVPHSSIH